MCIFICKDNANERNVSLLTNCRVQLIFCKDNANERNVSLLTNCRVQLIFCKGNTNKGIGMRKIHQKAVKSHQSLRFSSFFCTFAADNASGGKKIVLKKKEITKKRDK